MFCEKHPDYSAKRRPKVNCFSCWRLYLENKNLTVENVIEEASKAGNWELRGWLKESIDDIIYAPLGTAEKKNVLESEKKSEEAKSAVFSTKFSFVEEKPAPSEEKRESPNEPDTPAAGVKI